MIVVVVMGVAGSGKSTVGALIAQDLGADFAEGDRFHPPANIAKMSAGQPLNDADRLPWLQAMADASSVGMSATKNAPAMAPPVEPQPPITIMAPAHNESATIVDSTMSFLGLHYPSYELIIVNDDSKDDTLERLMTELGRQRMHTDYREDNHAHSA